ncbi:hypothetical protein X737_04665 [Mesorhizobium sp. L48C026A00]|nr:hypothetical protein X737_04665 [Mesorhizobium sp. L48C026A00]
MNAPQFALNSIKLGLPHVFFGARRELLSFGDGHQTFVGTAMLQITLRQHAQISG